MNKRLFPLVQAAMIAAALIGGNAASIVSAEDAPVIPQETALTDSAEPDTPEPESAPDEPAETPEEPEAPAEPEIVEFAAEPEEAALEALMSAPESEPIEPEIVQAAAETLSAMPTARKAAALKAMRPVTYVPEGLPEGVTLSVDVPPAAFSEPVEIYARFLTDPEDGSFSEDIIAAAQAQYEEALEACEEGYSAGVMLFDLSFVNEAGEEVEPALPVSVSLAFSDANESVEITGVRHFTDSQNVDSFDDLEFASENSEELTLNYITESCSSFTVTWYWNHLLAYGSPKLTVHFVDENGDPLDVPTPSRVFEGNCASNYIWDINDANAPDIFRSSEGVDYKLQGFTTVKPSLNNSIPSSAWLQGKCRYIQYYAAVLGGISINNGWWYSKYNTTERVIFNLRILSNNRKHLINDDEADADLYFVYYPDPYPVTLHYGTTLNPNVTSLDDCLLASETDTVNVSNGTLYDLSSHDYNNKNLGALTVYKKTSSGLVKVPDSELTLTNEYKNHPADDYYFIYYDPNYIPAPTGVTQKAAPYAAMVILAAVSAAVMIKRRKGGDVDETSPL